MVELVRRQSRKAGEALGGLVRPDDEDRVQERRIETGAAIDADWVVTSGLSAGERVIVQGVQKVKPGQIVKTVTKGAEAVN